MPGTTHHSPLKLIGDIPAPAYHLERKRTAEGGPALPSLNSIPLTTHHPMKTAIVIAFERLPLRRLGCYGRISSPTPHLDRFAAESVVFDWHFAENVDPDARNHAWWTGRYEFPVPHAEQQRRPAALFESLAAAGIEVAGIRESASRMGPRGRHVKWHEIPPSPGSQELFRHAAVRLEDFSRDGNGRRLLCIRSAELETSESESPAASEHRVRTIDAAVGRFLETAQERQRSTNAELLLIVTSATGIATTGSDATPLPDDLRPIAECIVHAPLLVYSSRAGGGPGRMRRRARTQDGGLRQSSLVQSVDLAPTLLEWFGVPFEAGRFDGMALLPLLRHNTVAPGREAVFFGDGLRSCGIRTREFCLIAQRDELKGDPAPEAAPASSAAVPPGVRLFVKPDDPWEVHNVAEQEPETVSRLLERLREFVREQSDRREHR